MTLDWFAFFCDHGLRFAFFKARVRASFAIVRNQIHCNINPNHRLHVGVNKEIVCVTAAAVRRCHHRLRTLVKRLYLVQLQTSKMLEDITSNTSRSCKNKCSETFTTSICFQEQVCRRECSWQVRVRIETIMRHSVWSVFALGSCCC